MIVIEFSHCMNAPLSRNALIGAAIGCSAFLSCAVAFPAEAATPQFTSKPEYSALFAELEKADAVVEGAHHSRHVLFVFFDPNCYYCHITWKALQAYEKAGLEVRWVPVAYQQSSSVGRAAAIMLARDRVAALRRNETTYDAKNYDGGIRPVKKPPGSMVASLQANTSLMGKFCSPGTPALLWKDRTGIVRCKAGAPRLSELPAITGLPEQKINDRELAEFR